jgi:hypothetical protein
VRKWGGETGSWGDEGVVVMFHIAMGGEGVLRREERQLPKARGMTVPTGTAATAR